jgi:chorismate--pyruvate lyase
MKKIDKVYVDKKQADEMRPWLSDPGSFMQRLKNHGITNAQIQILAEGWNAPFEEERRMLNLPISDEAWVREVSIQSDNRIWMYARTVIPQATLTGKERILQHLKTRSLGSILFSYPDMKRGEFDYFYIDQQSSWYDKIATYLTMPNEILSARRSMFTLGDKSLLLTEVFFPEIKLL